MNQHPDASSAAGEDNRQDPVESVDAQVTNDGIGSEGAADTASRHLAVPKIGGALGRTVAAGLSGEAVSAQGVLEAIGGVRGVIESLLPGLLFLTTYVLTQDARLSVIAPAVIALAATAWRLLKRQPLVSALAGLIGVGICVVTTLVTGKGEDYFLPGFWTNGIWSVALLGSLLVGWPLLGFIVGAVSGNLTGWKAERVIRRAATLCTLIWLLLFIARLAVQLPLYFSGAVGALGVARLVMGVPLYGLVVLFTWLVLRAAMAKRNAE